MTQKQAQTIEQALARAAKEGIRIVGTGTMKLDGARFWIVSSKTYATTGRAYIVELIGTHLECTCRAQGICKHRAVVHQVLKTLKDERQAEPSAPEQIRAFDQAKVAEQDAEMAARGQVWNAAQLRYEPAEPSVGTCPQCGGAMSWADSVHNAMRCQSCQHLIAGVTAKQDIYCEECGRFKSHCDAAGHANPPATWSRMGQTRKSKSEYELLRADERERDYSEMQPAAPLCEMCQEATAVFFSPQLRCKACQDLCNRQDKERAIAAGYIAPKAPKSKRLLSSPDTSEAFSIFAPSDGEALAAAGHGMIYRGQM